jgi:hypothetical protein
MKKQDPLPPFPRGGTHWSRLVGSRVAGLVVGEFDRLAGTDFGALTLGEPVWDAPPVGSDRDLAQLLNLLIPPYGYPTGDAALQCRSTAAGRKVNLIGLGGSFLDQIMDPVARCRLFARAEWFSYYTKFRRQYPNGSYDPVDREALDWAAIFQAPTVVVLEFNERAIEPKIQWFEWFAEDTRAALR